MNYHQSYPKEQTLIDKLHLKLTAVILQQLCPGEMSEFFVFQYLLEVILTLPNVILYLTNILLVQVSMYDWFFTRIFYIEKGYCTAK